MNGSPRNDSTGQATFLEWQRQLPTLSSQHVILRDLRASDAVSLHALLTPPEVARFLQRPPTSVEAFERFIGWAHQQRNAGTSMCFGLTLMDFDSAIGIFQIRACGPTLAIAGPQPVGPDFSVAEWGFALGSAFWGTGAFAEGADLLLEFAFDVLGVHRLEASSAVRNGRANRALLKIGAVQEGVLRKSLLCSGEYVDSALYAIVEDDWRRSRETSKPVDLIGVRR